ncbi:hypothetical protein LJ753_09980 [Arthrobacter sp. zg-Y20]|uniref:hypothetical protein n=1 Tax=unclassified Arthrobacter TaxID=235627 RepID=UPI001D13C4EA|nr:MULTISPECIES: hypothetical protein [unclassified Arthrobacter]MCC3276197.1 hypothetical protein [Arthrobacter sp. zg-Y20]MDK1316357.1 hypothetical protein [Arthrobacter sp. zg.Y20]
MLALFREAFTRTRPRVPLDDFHAMTDSFLNRLRMDSVQLREDWTGRNYADDRVARRFLDRPRADGKFVGRRSRSKRRGRAGPEGWW